MCGIQFVWVLLKFAIFFMTSIELDSCFTGPAVLTPVWCVHIFQWISLHLILTVPHIYILKFLFPHFQWGSNIIARWFCVTRSYLVFPSAFENKTEGKGQNYSIVELFTFWPYFLFFVYIRKEKIEFPENEKRNWLVTGSDDAEIALWKIKIKVPLGGYIWHDSVTLQILKDENTSETKPQIFCHLLMF